MTNDELRSSGVRLSDGNWRKFTTKALFAIADRIDREHRMALEKLAALFMRGERVMGAIIDRAWAMPNGNTFSIKPIKELVEECALAVDVCDGGVIVDPFAKEARYGTVTNDLNPDMPTDYHMDALEFLRTRGDEEADLVLYDPPYSITQAAALYKSYGKERLEVNVANMRYWKLVKDEIARITKRWGVVLSCGWNTNGMGKCRGFVLERIRIVSHGGSKNDTLVTIERKGGVQP